MIGESNLQDERLDKSKKRKTNQIPEQKKIKQIKKLFKE